MGVHTWSSHFAEGPDRRSTSSRFKLVQQAEILALARLDKPLHVAALCCRLAVSERTLRKAFMATYGLPPCRHLRMLRLLQVRQALMTPHNGVVTVTETATRFGFAELGRFAVEYRKVFGESPSMTLCRTSRAHQGMEETRTYIEVIRSTSIESCRRTNPLPMSA